ncbi:MAG: putative porin [Fulvivirga sp.]|uniref:putative porin n=1 Tax=Fulvivirga sp. TaxID=1931237 RepID=UPI0032EBA333
MRIKLLILLLLIGNIALGQRKRVISGDFNNQGRTSGAGGINSSPAPKAEKKVGSSILDDSTKQVYGPTTTQFTLEKHIKYNNQKWSVLDTSITDFHKHQFIARERNLYQNLGNIGTPISPIYPQAPDIIGGRSGFNIYDLYFKDPEEIKIYNTKSPYSKFGIIWGGQGRSITEAQYTRNIDERSNFGFNYRGLLIDKQIERERRGDRNVLGTYYNVHGNYRTKNGKYFVSGNFSRNNQEVAEYGGILIDPEDSTFRTYFKENRQANLQDAQTRELRTNYHLYQQYKLTDQVQFFHSHDRYKQLNDFTNTATSGIETDSAFFGPVALDTIPIKDRSKIIYRQHEVGVKGDIGKTFYSFYYRGREVNMDFKFIDEGELDYGTYYMEHYGGFNLRFGNDSLSYISVAGEYLSGENYKLDAEIRNTWFYAKGASSRYLPSYVQRAYLSRHNNWRNDYESTINTKLESGLNLNYKGLSFRPSVSYNLISDYVYLEKINPSADSIRNIQPQQAGGDVNIISADVQMSYTFFKRFVLKGQAIYGNVSGSSADAVNVPDFILNAQLFYTNIFYEGNLEMQFGIDYHQRSAYFANGYDPSSMQYFVQDEFEVNSYPLIDVFFNIKINRGRAFLKVNNIVERIRGTGYLITPYYPGQETILDFGIDWMLFD